MISKLIIGLSVLPLTVFSQAKKDTLEVPSHIKYIKIDGKIFEVVRSVEVKEIPKDDGYIWPRLQFPPNNSTQVGPTIFYNRFHPIYQKHD